MKKGPIVAAISLTLVASLALAPLASADRFRGGSAGRHVIVNRSGVSRPFVAHPFAHRPLVRPLIPFAVVTAPVVVYAPSPLYSVAPPTYYDSSASYYPPSSYYPPAVSGPSPGGTAAVAPAPAAPPMPSVVQYPHGRYELRGDGVTTPYTWVWIPNPPPPPPAPPGTAPSPSSQIYRWTDEQGVEHWTDRGDAVPPQYRAPTTRAQPS